MVVVVVVVVVVGWEDSNHTVRVLELPAPSLRRCAVYFHHCWSLASVVVGGGVVGEWV